MKYKLLDLCCCGGGASYGYELAGFEVVGVDIEPQPRYKGTFVQADGIEYLKAHHAEFDAFHVSAPCQQYSKASMQFRLQGKQYPELIAPFRDELEKIGKPYVIENVPNAPLNNPVVLCGSMFGLRTYRHRLFETNFPLVAPTHPEHCAKNTKMGRKPKDGEFIQYVGHFSGVSLVREMTGLYWLNAYELAQSIPPQYTQYIGTELLRYIERGNGDARSQRTEGARTSPLRRLAGAHTTALPSAAGRSRPAPSNERW